MAPNTIEIEPGITVTMRKNPEEGTLITMFYDPIEIDAFGWNGTMDDYLNHRRKKSVNEAALFDYVRFCREKGKPLDVRFVGLSDGLGTLVRHQVIEFQNVPPNMQKTGTYNR